MTKKNTKVLIVDDNEDILIAAKLLLKPYAAIIETEKNPNNIPELLKKGSYDVIFLDMNFTQDMTSGKEGFFWLNEILKIDPTSVVILITAYGDVEMAVKAGALLSNPAQLVTPPRYSSPEMDFYSEHEITQLLLAVKGTSLEALIHLAITTGMRQSELLALKWSDVDWDRNTITVQRQLRRNYEDHNYFSSLKTQAGKRTISLGNNTIQKLIEHHKSQKNEIERMGNQWVDNNLLFPSMIGTPLNQRNLLRSYKKILHESGLREIRFHDLRHTAASLMLNHGIPPLIVSKRLGHSKVSITLDTYGHLLPGMQQETADFIDGLVTPLELKLHTDCTRKIENVENYEITPNIKGVAR